tara:strand:- start:2767 stop:3711 length:945 start_codon:yes stop_codon:yes gene_type:complete
MNIVGYKSPFKKREVNKESPMKITDPATAQIALAAAPGVITAIGSLFGRKKRRREQAKARKQMKEARAAFEAIEYVNPYANLENPYEGLQNPYEDLTVNSQAADFLKEQQQQSQANLLANLRGVAGASGVAGLAQSLSNISTNQARQASISIAQQERQNQLLAARGAFGVDKMRRAGQFQVDQLQAKGEAIRKAQEDARTKALFGLAIDRKTAADRARQQARSQFFSGLGQAAAGVGGLYMPGGARSGKFAEDFGFGGGATPQPDMTYKVPEGTSPSGAPLTVPVLTPNTPPLNISGQSPSYIYEDPLGYNPFG